MLAQAFDRSKRAGRLAFIPYVMAGDPDLATTEALLEALSAAGADVIELGIPYSDPLADGPTIASAGARALAAGTRVADVLGLVRRCAASSAPIVLFTYFNPIFRFGIERFAEEAAAAGVAGAIVPDVALEEADELRRALQARGIAMPLLIAPTSSPERSTQIAAAATGFVYVVSRLGVTGASSAPNLAPLSVQLGFLRQCTSKPLAIGFGLSRPEDVRNFADLADAVVVGSALIDACAARRGAEAAQRAIEFLTPLIVATRGRLLPT
jgi:tryptophan synthase alpha chain